MRWVGKTITRALFPISDTRTHTRTHKCVRRCKTTILSWTVSVLGAKGWGCDPLLKEHGPDDGPSLGPLESASQPASQLQEEPLPELEPYADGEGASKWRLLFEVNLTDVHTLRSYSHTLTPPFPWLQGNKFNICTHIFIPVKRWSVDVKADFPKLFIGKAMCSPSKSYNCYRLRDGEQREYSGKCSPIKWKEWVKVS